MAHALASDRYRQYFKEWEHYARPFGSGGFGEKEVLTREIHGKVITG